MSHSEKKEEGNYKIILMYKCKKNFILAKFLTT